MFFFNYLLSSPNEWNRQRYNRHENAVVVLSHSFLKLRWNEWQSAGADAHVHVLLSLCNTVDCIPYNNINSLNRLNRRQITWMVFRPAIWIQSWIAFVCPANLPSNTFIFSARLKDQITLPFRQRFVYEKTECEKNTLLPRPSDRSTLSRSSAFEWDQKWSLRYFSFIYFFRSWFLCL